MSERRLPCVVAQSENYRLVAIIWCERPSAVIELKYTDWMGEPAWKAVHSEAVGDAIKELGVALYEQQGGR